VFEIILFALVAFGFLLAYALATDKPDYWRGEKHENCFWCDEGYAEKQDTNACKNCRKRSRRYMLLNHLDQVTTGAWQDVRKAWSK
jgi:hypothetical protein